MRKNAKREIILECIGLSQRPAKKIGEESQPEPVDKIIFVQDFFDARPFSQHDPRKELEQLTRDRKHIGEVLLPNARADLAGLEMEFIGVAGTYAFGSEKVVAYQADMSRMRLVIQYLEARAKCIEGEIPIWAAIVYAQLPAVRSVRKPSGVSRARIKWRVV